MSKALPKELLDCASHGRRGRESGGPHSRSRSFDASGLRCLNISFSAVSHALSFKRISNARTTSSPVKSVEQNRATKRSSFSRPSPLTCPDVLFQIYARSFKPSDLKQVVQEYNMRQGLEKERSGFVEPLQVTFPVFPSLFVPRTTVLLCLS